MKNQDTIMSQLAVLERKYAEDHDRIIEQQKAIEHLDERMDTYDKYLYMVISVVIAQIFVVVSQVILPKLL